MNEIEVKILEINKEELISKLENLWAIKTFEWDIENEFYENSDWKRIRLRKIWWKNIMTFKVKQESENMKSNMEYEVEFVEYETFKIILENIWFKFYAKTYKKRISYHLWDITFDIDDFPGIPTFVEVEAQNEQDVKKWIELLWYKMEDTQTFWERELKKYYNLI